MAHLPEPDEFPEGIYQLEDSDPVKGGAPNEGTGEGMDNIPHAQLARRTRWLKARVDGLLEAVVAASDTVAGIVRLTSSLTSTSTTVAASAAAVKAANDNANSRVPSTRTVTGAGLAAGGGALTGNQVITVAAASKAEAEAGADNARAMTALRTRQAIIAAMSQTLAVSGWTKLPNGLLLQWGRQTTSGGGVVSVVFPVTFPAAGFTVVASDWTVNIDLADSHTISTGSLDQYGFQVMSNRAGVLAPTTFSWFAIGN